MPKSIYDPEKVEQERIKAFCRAMGWVPCSTSQYRASKQHVGLPDLYIFARTRAFWWESKRVDSIQKKAQQDFERRCLACDVFYGIGTAADFIDHYNSVYGRQRVPIPANYLHWQGKRAKK